MEKFYCEIWGHKISENQCYLKGNRLEYYKNPRYCLRILFLIKILATICLLARLVRLLTLVLTT